MNREETKKAIEVMQAWADGREIHVRRRAFGVWSKKLADCNWNWHEYEYRVKPEPREWWVRADIDCLIDPLIFSPTDDATYIRVREVIE